MDQWWWLDLAKEIISLAIKYLKFIKFITCWKFLVYSIFFHHTFANLFSDIHTQDKFFFGYQPGVVSYWLVVG